MRGTVSASLPDGRRMLAFGDEPPVPADRHAMMRARLEAPYLAPVPLGLEPSFGFGDRTGLATAGHVEGLVRSGTGIRPIFAQQSIREMARTGRSPREVVDDAAFGVLLSGYSAPLGADADHLKSAGDVDATASAGFRFFTVDPSDDVDPRADNYTGEELRARFAGVREHAPWLERYLGTERRLPPDTTIEFSEEICLRAAVKYGRAIQRTVELCRHIARSMGALPYEIELSVDETPQPTTLAEHWIIAEQCREAGLELVSLAPRYIGDFEKGVDYKGDVAAFERSLADHAAIAKALGPYKLSLHSGSDKLSIYPSFARATGGRFHVKTAGTSYLEALRVLCRHESRLFREIVRFARERYDTDRATYHVSATLDGVPPPADVPDAGELERLYLGRWCDAAPGCGLTEPGRQILHCTFGSVLSHTEYGPAVRDVLRTYPETYREILADHFERHLRALAAGMGPTT